MQKCNLCGENIRYIANSANSNIICDDKLYKFVTINGRMINGYLIHNCKGFGKKDGKTR